MSSFFGKIGAFITRIIKFLVNKWKFSVPVTAALLGLGIYLFFFLFAFHLYFIDDKVDDDLIVFASGAQAAFIDDDGDMPGATSEAESNAGIDQMSVGFSQDENDGDSNVDETTTTVIVPDVEIQRSDPAEFMSRAHRTSGQAYFVTDGTQTFIRFEDLKTDNGPDLNVYLVPFPGDASSGLYNDDFVDLGDLEGNIGDQNYEVPDGTDLDKYSTAVIWCVRFNVAFGTVELNSLP